jgi:hypothetical protein
MSELTDDTARSLAEQIALLTKVLQKNNKASPSSKGPSPSAGRDSNYRGAVTDQAAAQKLIQNQSRLSGATQSVTQGLQKTTHATMAVANKFGTLSNAAGKLSSNLASVAKAFGAGGALMAIATQLDKTTDTYRELNAVGQSFGGSMLAMHQAAAGAALPLEQFAEVVKKNSVVMATIGQKAFFDMGKQVRASMTDVGMLGMTTAQLNDFMGEYMETQRLYGNSSSAINDKTASTMKTLMTETQKAAEMTGMNRDALAKATQDVLRDTTLRAKMLQIGANGTDAFSVSLQKTTTYLTALPGIAGQELSKMLAQSVGRGSALMADQTAMFAEAGMLGVTDLMDNLARKVQAGTATGEDVAEFNRKFVAEGKRNMESLRLQASAGNKAAQQAIEMISEMEAVSKKNPVDPAKQKAMTNMMLNFSEIVNQISGMIRGKFLEGLEKVLKGFDGFTETETFKKLEEKVGSLASRFGAFLGETLTPENIEAFGNGLASFATGLVAVTTFLVGAVDTVVSSFGWLSDKIGVLGAAVAVFATYMGGKALIKQTGSLLAERFTIGGGRQESFSQALNRFAAGNTLRVTNALPGGGAGGPDLDDDGPDRDRNRNRNDRDEPDRRRRNPREIEGPREPRGNRIQRRLAQFGDAGQSFRQRAARTLGAAVRRPGTMARVAGRSGMRALRAVPGRVAGSRTAGRVTNGVQRAGGAVRRAGGAVARGAGAVARGGMNLARGIGPGALAGMAVAGGLEMLPDFKGKETLQTMASFAAMGSMLGPIGAAVGAGVGALYANWDDLSGIASSAFTAVKDFDYSGVFKKAGAMLAPIGDAAKWVGEKYIAGWKAVGNFALDGLKAVRDFDYSGALKKAGEFLAPVGEGAKWIVGKYVDSWKAVGGFAMAGFTAIKDFDYAGALNTAGQALAPIGDGAKWIVGKYVDSWKAVGGFAMDGLMAIKDFDYTGALNKAGEFLSPLKDGASWMMDTYINTWKSVGNGLMDGIKGIANFDYGALWAGVKDVGASMMNKVSSAFSSIGSSLGGMFNWASDLLKPKAGGGGLFDTLMNLNPVTAAVNTLTKPNANLSAPNTPQQAPTPQVNTDTMTSQMNEMKAQSARISKENSELKAQMAVLMDQLAKGNASQVGGLKDLIAEQKKSNGNLSTLANNVI